MRHVIAAAYCLNPEPLAALWMPLSSAMVAPPQRMELVREKRAQQASRATFCGRHSLPGIMCLCFTGHITGMVRWQLYTHAARCARACASVWKSIWTTPGEMGALCRNRHDRIVLEIMRGCTRGCRFCQAGMLYRPVRERSVDKLMDLAEKLVAATGYDEISLSSLSSGDYSCLQELVTRLMERFKDQRVGLSLPSMRLDSLIKQTLEETSEVRKSGLTLAPEAGTQRLRDVINKGVTEQDLHNAVSDAFQSGWSSVKLYFMLGLPTETDEDLLAIGDLAKQVEDAYYAVPKGQRAPACASRPARHLRAQALYAFQWAAQDTLPEIGRKQAVLRSALKRKSTTFNWHEPELSFLEACFARGDRRLERCAVCGLAAWVPPGRLAAALPICAVDGGLHDCGLDPALCQPRAQPRLLPWDFIDAGVTKRFC